MKLRWDQCVFQQGDAVDAFLKAYVDSKLHNCLLIGGAGFDPRALVIPQKFATLKHATVRGVFFREKRPMRQNRLRIAADDHQALLSKFIPESHVLDVDIFAQGKTPVGGRRVVQLLRDQITSSLTDIFIDISALSSGVFFPLVRFCLELSRPGRSRCPVNVHLLVAEAPNLDHQIRGIHADIVTWVHGFRSEFSLEGGLQKALLWLPTLAPGHTTVHNRIYSFISRTPIPIDVCPIVPFPSENPRLADSLMAEYYESFRTWRTDTKNILYAAESDPLDGYRTICTICSARDRTFENLGGSAVILSPTGNKLLAVGAMLAALEKDLPIATVECVGYEEAATVQQASTVYHLWLSGVAYAESQTSTT